MKLRERLVRLLSTDGKQSICEPPVVREPSLAANRRMLPPSSETESCSSRKIQRRSFGWYGRVRHRTNLLRRYDVEDRIERVHETEQLGNLGGISGDLDASNLAL